MKKRWLVVVLVMALFAVLTYCFEFSPYFPDRSPLFVTPGPGNVTLKFPEHFYWGVSLSGTQAESQQASDWAAFERDVVANRRFNAGREFGTTEPGNIRDFRKWSDKVRSQNSEFDSFYQQDIAMAAAKSRCACHWGGWGRVSVDGPGQHNLDRNEDPWGRAEDRSHGSAHKHIAPDTEQGISMKPRARRTMANQSWEGLV